MKRLLIIAALGFSATVVPCVAADDSTVLLPIGLFRIPGAYGSIWQSELAMKNTGATRFFIRTAVDRCSVTVCPFVGAFKEAPGATSHIENEGNVAPLSSESGLLVQIGSDPMDHGSPRDVIFNLRVRDMSRLTSSLGTEVPVARGSDFRLTPIQLLNVPVSDGFRTTVRIYSLDESILTLNAVARVRNFESGAVLLEQTFQLQRTVEDPHFYPLYARLDHLIDSLPQPRPARVIIELSTSDVPQPLWAFASITNNETQQLTVIAPE